MNTSVQNEIDSIIKSNILCRFGLELTNTQDSERKKQITQILSNYNNIKNDDELIKEKREKMFEDIDKNVYKQKWSKLQSFHKETKLTEYVNATYNNHPNKEKILNFLLNELKNEKFKNEKIINYDPKNSKITNIINLEVTDDIIGFSKETDTTVDTKKNIIKKDNPSVETKKKTKSKLETKQKK